jgi:hypothetical protein
LRTLLLLLAGSLALAGPVRFSGSTRLYGEYGWVAGDKLVKPRPELRLDVRPSVSFWGIPLGLDIMLSTQESSVRQQLDRFRLFLNPREWLESRTDLSGLALSFKGLELGSCSPSWTEYTLSGAPVFGGAVELNPWYLYAAAAAGRTQRRTPVSDSTRGAYARMLYSARFGFGKKEGTHFYATALYAADDTTPPENNWQPNPSDTQPPVDSFEVVRPKENYVLGLEFNLDVADGAFRLESEFAGCEVTRDSRMPVESWDWLPDWVARTFKPRMSSSIDLAFKVRPIITYWDTKLSAELEFVGPGFKSVGAPNLRNDNYLLGAGIERSFLDNALFLAARYSSERDNLLAVRDDSGRILRLKSRTNRITRWEARLSLSLPNLPYLSAGYYPYTQQDDSSTATGTVFSASAGHGFQTGRLLHSPALSVGYSDLRSSDPAADYTGWNCQFSHSVSFDFPLALSASAGYSRSVSAGTKDNLVSFSVAPSYTLLGSWTNTLAIGGSVGSSTRIDASLSSSFPVWKLCEGRVGITDVVYRGSDGTYNDLRLTAELSRSW